MADTEVKVGKLPYCNYCQQRGAKVLAKYDGATRSGPWAFMCQDHFDVHGRGLGMGIGQRLVLIND